MVRERVLNGRVENEIKRLQRQYFEPFAERGNTVQDSIRKTGKELEVLLVYGGNPRNERFGRAINLRTRDALFQELADNHGWKRCTDGTMERDFGWGNVTLGNDAGVALLELGMTPHSNLRAAGEEIRAALEPMIEAASRMSLVVCGGGVQPRTWPDLSTLETMTPKSRYKGFVKAIGPEFAYQSVIAAAQVQFDIGIGEIVDFMNIFTYASPVFMALYGYSSISEGKPNGWKEYRRDIWIQSVSNPPGNNAHLHMERVGLPRLSDSREEYFRNLLELPPMVIKRGDRTKMGDEGYYWFADTLPMIEHIANGGASVRSTQTGEQRGISIGLDDIIMLEGQKWQHVRVKPAYKTIELRVCPEQSSVDAILSIAALGLGLLANKERVLRYFSAYTHEDLLKAEESAAMDGMKGRYGSKPMLNVIRGAVALAEDGLTQSGRSDDAKYLAFIKAQMCSAENPADRALRAYESEGRVGQELINLLRLQI